MRLPAADRARDARGGAGRCPALAAGALVCLLHGAAEEAQWEWVSRAGFQVPGSGFQVAGSSVTHHASRITHRVVRGGWWFDKPNRARSAFRWKHPARRKVHHVGFRVAVELD